MLQKNQPDWIKFADFKLFSIFESVSFLLVQTLCGTSAFTVVRWKILISYQISIKIVHNFFVNFENGPYTVFTMENFQNGLYSNVGTSTLKYQSDML